MDRRVRKVAADDVIGCGNVHEGRIVRRSIELQVTPAEGAERVSTEMLKFAVQCRSLRRNTAKSLRSPAFMGVFCLKFHVPATCRHAPGSPAAAHNAVARPVSCRDSRGLPRRF